MAENTTDRTKLWLYVRMIIASGLVGLAFGYYLQVIGRVEMTPAFIVEFIVRGALIGAFFWGFEIFYIHGARGQWLKTRSSANRLVLRVIAYLIIFEVGFFLGEVLFDPSGVAKSLKLSL